MNKTHRILQCLKIMEMQDIKEDAEEGDVVYAVLEGNQGNLVSIHSNAKGAGRKVEELMADRSSSKVWSVKMRVMD